MTLTKRISEYLFVAVGSFVLAFAVNFFLLPLKISTGGVSTVATVVYYVLDIPLSLTALFFNLILFFFGYKTLKKDSVLKSVAGIIFLSLFLELTSKFGNYSDDILICSIFGGILVGVGVGITVLFEGSTGGSDFAALIFHKIFPRVSVATFILLIDSGVIFISGIVFHDYTIMFYSLISLYISTRLTEYIVNQGTKLKK